MPLSFTSSLKAILLAVAITAYCLVPKASPLILAVLAGYGLYSAWPIRLSINVNDVSHKLALCALAIIALGFLSGIWAVHPEDAVSRMLKTLPLILGAIVALKYFVMTPQVWGRLAIGLTIAAWVVGGIILYDKLTDYAVLRWLEKDLINSSSWTRSLITIYTLAVPAAVYFLRYGHKTWLIALLVPLITMLFVTESQTLQLGMAVAVIVYLLSRYRALWNSRAAYAVIALVVLSLPWIFMTLFQAAPALENNPWMRSAYAADRLEIWNFISDRVVESPLIGFGVEATRNISDFNSDMLFRPNASVLHPHSALLQMWIEMGVAGALLAVCFLILSLKVIAARPAGQQRVFVTLFATLLFAALITYGLWQAWWLALIVCTFSFLRGGYEGMEKPRAVE